MLQFGGKNAKKTSSDSKRHFTVVMGDKEHGLYVSSSPSSAAKKAVTKLCISNKSKKVEFYMREITQNSKKKTYGPYEGYIEKLKEPIKLKGRVIKYKPVAKLSDKKGVKKGVMKGGGESNAKKCFHDRKNKDNIETTALRLKASPNLEFVKNSSTGNAVLLHKNEEVIKIQEQYDGTETYFLVEKNDGYRGWVRAKYIKCPAKARVVLLNINNFNNLSLKQNNTSWKDGFQPNYAGTSRLQRPSANFSRYQGQPANLSGLRRHSAFPEQSANFSGLLEQPAYNQRLFERLPGLRGQSVSLSAYPVQPANLSVSTNIQVPQKLYNSVDNLELFESISGHIIPNVFIQKGQVVDVLETVEHFNYKYNKIGVLTPQGYIEGFVLSKNLKKTRWLCDHNACLKYNGPYDKDQTSNKRIPVSVAIILRNSQGDILVGTETDATKMSEFNKSMPGFHLCAGKIDSGSCPVFSSYDETAEESRFLPVVKDDYRNFRERNGWDSMFKPNGKYIIEPWVSSGRAMVFVGKIGDKFWDASNPPYGEQQTFTRPKQLDNVFEELRKKLKKTKENHKYLEKIEFKWVKPLPSGSLEADWERWSRENQMFGWGRSIIKDYVGHSAKPAPAQPLRHNFSRQSTSLRGMSAPLPAVSYHQDVHFDSQIILLINKQIREGETRLNDLLELCKKTYYGMFQNQIPEQKLSNLRQYILSQFFIKQNNKTNNPLFYQYG